MLLAGCEGPAGAPGKDGSGCTSKTNTDGSKTISCADGTSVTITDGEDGTGIPGKSCTVETSGTTKTITCEDGTTATITDGTDGSSCTVRDNNNGTKTITCGTVSVTIANGADGEDGLPGGNSQITNFHGEGFLLTSGEFKTAGKKFVKATIDSATAAADGTVTVNFTVMDGTTPVTGLTKVNLLVAKLVPAPAGVAYPSWVPYTQRTETTTAGTWPNPVGTTAAQGSRESVNVTSSEPGKYTASLSKKLGEYKVGGVDTGAVIAYERNLTHRAQIMMGGHSGPTAEATFDFVPDGSAMTLKHNVVPTATCTKCHGFEFHGHGGDRLTMEGCVTCHETAGKDANGSESIDMATMIHKIHAGAERAKAAGADGLVFDDPTTTADESADNGTYCIWGNSNSKHCWGTAEFPAVGENCTACHEGDLPQKDNWKTVPSRKACGSCHDDVDFAAGTHHLAQQNDNACSGCHPATEGTTLSAGGAVTEAHEWFKKDVRNIAEFTAELSVSAPANGTHFVKGEKPKVTVVLKENGTAIDHTAIFAPKSGDALKCTDNAGCTTGTNGVCTIPAGSTEGTCGTAQGCTPNTAGDACVEARDNNFSSSKLFVSGPRANRAPVLTYVARAKIIATCPTGQTAPACTWDLSTAKSALILKVDAGTPVLKINEHGEDLYVPGTITVNVADMPTTVTKTAVTGQQLVDWLNANKAFAARAIAYLDEYTQLPAIRSRNLGKVFSVQLQASDVATKVFANDTGVKTIGGSTVSAVLAKPTVAANTDPKVAWFTDRIEYTLDPVDDLQPGTYTVYVEISDKGRVDNTKYVTPTVGKTYFQVGTATTEKLVANNCNSCHQSASGEGYVLDFPRHNKKFDNAAVDGCGACHDYQPQTGASTSYPNTISGAIAISQRVHAVHNGAALNYPLNTVAHEESVAGRNWRITYPMDVRNCESCHTDATTGTWATKANRLACQGCHDSDAASAHIKAQVYDPTPADAWNGDEQESCQSCH